MGSLELDDYRALELFPPSGTSNKIYKNTWLEDDGLSANACNHISDFTVEYESFVLEVHVRFSKGKKNMYQPLWNTLTVVLPVNDERNVINIDGKKVVDKGRDQRGRRKFEVEL